MIIQSFVPSRAARPKNLPLESTGAGPKDSLSLSSEGDYVEGQVIVKLQPGLNAASLVADYGAKLEREFQLPPAMAEKIGGRLLVMDLPSDLSTEEAMISLKSDQRVALAVPNHLVRSFGCEQETPPEEPPEQEPYPNDLHPDQWGLFNEGQTEGTPGVDISIHEAWEITTGSRSGPVIAIVDSGIDYGHPELAPNLWHNSGESPDGADTDGNGYVDDLHGVNFLDGSGDPSDDSGHGTHIASIIAAEGNNGQGMAGINWQAQIMPLKFLESSGRGSIANAISAIAYAESQEARLVVNGWGSEVQNQALFEVIEASQAMHICASGNDGYDNDIRPVHPASFPLDNIIAVAATDHNDEFTRFSNNGETSVDLSAPGRKVYSLSLDDEYKLLGGTSTAAAHVAGVAGLILTKYPELDNESLRTRLLSGVDPLPKRADRVVTGGRLNAAKALEDDTTPPAAPGDLWVTRLDEREVGLSWTASGDDGMEGRAHHYELRYASGPIVDGEPAPGEVRFQEASPITAPKPGEPGQTEYASVDLGPSGQARTIHFAVRAVDNVGNHSPLSTAQAKLPNSPVAFEDRFDDPHTSWTSEGDWGRVEAQGRGWVWTDSPKADYANNVDASLTSQEISLDGWRHSKLYFDARYTIEPEHDACYVEVYGRRWFQTKWRTVATLDGFSDWKNQEVDLSSYDGQDIKLRFRMATDDSRTAYGIQLDNVVVTGEKESRSGDS